MRIVGGRLKGRVLAAPGSRDIRPTSERLREAMFDILEHRYPGRIEGRRVIDCFAGSGALAIEALSRGARFALLDRQRDGGARASARQRRGAGLGRRHPHLAGGRDEARRGPGGRSVRARLPRPAL